MAKYTTRGELEELLRICLTRLLREDSILLKNDVSERSITHKLAEYLQIHFEDHHVDCEYNRDVTAGECHTKKLHLELGKALQADVSNMFMRLAASGQESEARDLSAYPDIIVHQRGTNEGNLLVVEVKKRRKNLDRTMDFRKLEAFTIDDLYNHFHFTLGVSIVLEVGAQYEQAPELVWFAKGERLR